MPEHSGKENTSRKIIPLVSTAFTPGACRAAIEAIGDPDERAMAWADYYQYTGDAKEAIDRAEPYLTHADPVMRMSAHIVCFISGLGIGDADSAQRALSALEARRKVEDGAPVSGDFCANILKIMLFLQEQEYSMGNDVPAALPEGAGFFVCYFLALREYLRDEYERAVGIAEGALMLGGSRYPIAGIYLHIIAAASLVRVKRHGEAEEHFRSAWDLALPDGFIAPFAQQYVILAGLNRRQVKRQYEEQYRAISRYADSFIPAWFEAHNGLVHWYEKNYGLTKNEHIVAMLFRKGFTLKEIAGCMGLSINTIKRHIAVAYQKTNAEKRDDFPQNIIR